MSPLKTQLVNASFVVTIVMAFASAGVAAPYTWIGTGGNVSWSTTGNWGGGTPPVSGTDTRIEFSDTTVNVGTELNPLNQNIGSPLQLNSLTFTGTTERVYFLSGGPLQFVADGANQPSYSSVNPQDKILFNDIQVGSGVQLSLRPLSFTHTFNGIVSGSGALVMDSQALGGQMTLGNAANSYSGGTVYNGFGSGAQFNALLVPVSGALGTGTVTLNGGNLLPSGSENQQPGGLSLSSGGGATSFANTFSLSNDSSLFVGLFATGASSASTSLSGSVLLNSSTLTLRGAGSGTIAGVVTSSGGGLAKLDGGTWQLSGSNTYTGATTVSQGRLEIAPGGSINGSSGVTLNGATAELKYNSGTALTAPITFTQGTISGTGAIGTAVAAGSGDTLSPGNSPGIQPYTAGLAWNPDGTYAWELNALTGAAGTNWDRLDVTGGLNLSGLSAGGKFNLNLITLTSGNVAGPLGSPYVAGSSYQFTIATFDTLSVPGAFSNAAGSDLTSLFAISLSGWQGTQPALADISVKVNQAGTGIDLVVVPEPGALALAGIGIAAAAWIRRRTHQK